MIGYNDIDILPDELGKCESLKILDVKKNQLVVLPPTLADLKNIKTIELSLNPVTTTLNQAARGGMDSLLAHLRTGKSPFVVVCWSLINSFFLL